MVVKALGAEWHAGCFCCVVSNSFLPSSLPKTNEKSGMLWAIRRRPILPPRRI
jgi:hypothetical protein